MINLLKIFLVVKKHQFYRFFLKKYLILMVWLARIGNSHTTVLMKKIELPGYRRRIIFLTKFLEATERKQE